ncbi:MAG: tetratricopeptide repeat protein [Candidatus Koribacter versatilis]|uniref:Tetratricopeptide repeat protein n=1 Tax=Candidatus Korobacter versatilis TaxID=658062 RepID=A0A932ABR4_9BACT|nr:tetratricopeptide repeat protein [Candidatus Koribacter versatilis]
MKFKAWFTNRVVIGMVLFFVIMAMWEFKWKPQYRPFYENGVASYQKGRYSDALEELNRAYSVAPNALDVIVMLGWTNLKLNHFEDARFYFDRALRIDPRTEEAQIGASFVALETGRGKIDYALLNKMLGRRGQDPNVRILAAGALVQQGKNLEAAAIYQQLLHDRDYGKASQIALEELVGNKGFNDPVPSVLPEIKRPAQTQVHFRSADGSIWRLNGSTWEKFYVNGINLGPGAPGFFPSKPPSEGLMYKEWIDDASRANANVIRLYTLLPPGFYRAYKHYLDGGGKMQLMQQVWIGDPPNKDLYDPKFVEETKAEIRYVIDAVHGHGDIPPHRARGNGIYENDISANVAGYLFGRELEPSVAQQTNVINGGKSKLDGKFISVQRATATEVWFAEMLDYLVAYEYDTYNWQHPVAIVNWPPMDPLTHPTEATNLEEVKFRIRKGEQLSIPKGLEDDNDATAIDEAKYRATGALYAGFFASYHVYPYYPDFLLLDPQYLSARDSEGLNPVYGYLKDLRAHIPHALVITEYGMPSSMGISHFHPYGWHHGGHNEEQQAQILVRLGKTIKETGCAGGVLFELMDEWYKHNWLTVDFESPVDRANLWLNDLDPEKRYGIVGFHTSNWKLFTGDAAAWSALPKENTLYTSSTGAKAFNDGYDGARSIRSVQAATDEGYLYLRLALACLDCPGKDRKKDAKPDFSKAMYAVAINTMPSSAGIRRLPFGELDVKNGANFLLLLGDPTATRLLVADTYNPYQVLPKPGVPNETEISYRRGYTPSLQQRGTFMDFVVETNRRRYGRDGTAYPGTRYSRSLLRYGNGDAQAADYDSLAEWFVDSKNKAIVARIPWGKLLMTDPSSRVAWFGFDGALNARTASSSGVDISVLALKPGGAPDNLTAMQVAMSFPAPAGGALANPASLAMKPWETVKPEPYFKKAYYAIQKEFLEEHNAEPTAPDARTPALRAVGGRARSGGPGGR